MKLNDCSKYNELSGEHLACEFQNEQMKDSYQQGFAMGGLLFFIVGLALMWVVCWCEAKEKKLKNKN